MRIYQQIVGNHSCGYVIKGTFKSRKTAKEVENDIKTFMWLLNKFNAEDADDTEEISREVNDFLKKWNIRFTDECADWEEEYEPRLKNKCVTVSLYTAGIGVDEIAKIMKKSGGKVLVSDSEDIKEY